MFGLNFVVSSLFSDFWNIYEFCFEYMPFTCITHTNTLLCAFMLSVEVIASYSMSVELVVGWAIILILPSFCDRIILNTAALSLVCAINLLLVLSS